MEHYSHYCELIAMPQSWHRPADFILAGVFSVVSLTYMSSAVNWINPWIAFTGGIMGLFIGAVRIYEILSKHK